MVKTYNVGAHGIPEQLRVSVSNLTIALRYTRHAMTEALRDRYGALPALSYPRCFHLKDGWELVEATESAPGVLEKFVVRRPADARRSLVMVVLRDGTVKTLWTNLNTDAHATLDKSKFSQP